MKEIDMVQWCNVILHKEKVINVILCNKRCSLKVREVVVKVQIIEKIVKILEYNIVMQVIIIFQSLRKNQLIKYKVQHKKIISKVNKIRNRTINKTRNKTISKIKNHQNQVLHHHLMSICNWQERRHKQNHIKVVK